MPRGVLYSVWVWNGQYIQGEKLGEVRGKLKLIKFLKSAELPKHTVDWETKDFAVIYSTNGASPVGCILAE